MTRYSLALIVALQIADIGSTAVGLRCGLVECDGMGLASLLAVKLAVTGVIVLLTWRKPTGAIVAAAVMACCYVPVVVGNVRLILGVMR